MRLIVASDRAFFEREGGIMHAAEEAPGSCGSDIHVCLDYCPIPVLEYNLCNYSPILILFEKFFEPVLDLLILI